MKKIKTFRAFHKYFEITILNSFLLLNLLNSCSGDSGSTVFGISALPEKPSSVVIEWYEGGGMNPESENIYISKDSSYWSHWLNDHTQRVDFSVTDAELNSLYKVFLETDFDMIRLIEEQEVYDRGGTSIRLIADGKYYDKNNSGMTFLNEADVDEYTRVEMEIYNLAMAKIESSKISTRIEISDELINSGYLIYLGVNEQTIINTDDTVENYLFERMVYPGGNEFDLALYDPDSNDYYGYPREITRLRLVKEITDSGVTIKFHYKNGIISAE